MATAAGIDMMPCRLINVEDKRHFVTLRFDREGDHKLHMQTLAAFYPDADSYEKLLMVCRKMRLPESTQEEIFRRMVFNILANNTDDHNKNFSFLMNQEGHWRLSPAYDMTYIFNTGGFLPETNHCLFMSGKLSGHTKDDALTLAKENGIRKAEAIIRQVSDAIARFRIFAQKYEVQDRWTNAVEKTLNNHLESWGYASSRTHAISLEIEGLLFTDVHIEQTYKGNYHLYATKDNKERKFVISKSKPEYELIQSAGTENLTEEDFCGMIKKYMM